jgi:hypothetical protein
VEVSNLSNAVHAPYFAAVSDENFMGLEVTSESANMFLTGNNPMSLDSITLSVGGGTGTGFTAALCSDAGGLPGSVLVSLDGNSSPTGGLYDYTPSVACTLAANTTYWVVLSSTSDGGTFSLNVTGDPSETGDVGWSIGDSYYSIMTGLGGGGWTANSGAGAMQFSVSASAVPEPSCLMGGVCGMIMVLRRRR